MSLPNRQRMQETIIDSGCRRLTDRHSGCIYGTLSNRQWMQDTRVQTGSA